MKKSIFLVISTCLLYACTKQTSTSTSTGEGYWFLYKNSINFNVYSTQRDSTGSYFIVKAVDSFPSLDTLQVFFLKKPTITGKYDIVNANYTAPAYSYNTQTFNLMANQVGFKGTGAAIPTFYSTGKDYQTNVGWIPSAQADITVTNGKIRIDIPRTIIISSVPSAYIDSFDFRASIIEK